MMENNNEARTPYNEPWRNGLIHFEMEQFEYGDIIEHEWFCCAMGLTPRWVLLRQRKIEEAESAQWEYLENMDRLKREILREYRIMLDSVRGIGYQVVHPRDQTTIASFRADHSIKKAIVKATEQVAYIRMDELTDDEKARNRDAQAKLSFFAKTVKDQRKLEIAKRRLLEDKK